MTRQTPVSRSISRWALAAVAVVVLGAAAAVWASSDAPAASGPTMSDDATVAGLDPALQDAIRDAITDAAADGVEIRITSGWRSPEEQERLWREAVAEYGSEAEAARWVAPVDASAHVTGDAVDVGPTDAMSWLSQHGARYGLCQTYANELWHFELRPDAVVNGCPAPYVDATEDPRFQ